MARKATPWEALDHIALVTVNLLCGLGVLSCWIGAAMHVHWHPQLRWLEGAITAAITAAVADCMWLLTGMRRIRSHRAELGSRVGGLAVPVVPSARLVRYVTADRMTTYHLPSCLLVHGKQVRTASAAEVERAERNRCRMCQP
jgi:hypothetical protein